MDFLNFDDSFFEGRDERIKLTSNHYEACILEPKWFYQPPQNRCTETSDYQDKFIADCLFSEGQYEQALARYLAGIDSLCSDSLRHELLDSCIRCYIHLGKLDSAIALLDKYLQEATNFEKMTSALSLAVEVYTKFSMNEELVSSLEKLLLLHPTNGLFWRQYAVTLGSQMSKSVTTDQSHRTSVNTDHSYCTSLATDKSHCKSVTADQSYCTSVNTDQSHHTSVNTDQSHSHHTLHSTVGTPHTTTPSSSQNNVQSFMESSQIQIPNSTDMDTSNTVNHMCTTHRDVLSLKDLDLTGSMTEGCDERQVDVVEEFTNMRSDAKAADVPFDALYIRQNCRCLRGNDNHTCCCKVVQLLCLLKARVFLTRERSDCQKVEFLKGRMNSIHEKITKEVQLLRVNAYMVTYFTKLLEREESLEIDPRMLLGELPRASTILLTRHLSTPLQHRGLMFVGDRLSDIE